MSSKSVNQVTLIGRLGQDVDYKLMPDGKEVANFSIATSESWIDRNNQKVEKTTWHRVVVWGKLAGICNEYIHKGSQVYIQGKLQNRSYDKDGHKVYVTEIIADTVQFLSRPKGDEEKTTVKSESKNNSVAKKPNSDPDEIPF